MGGGGGGGRGGFEGFVESVLLNSLLALILSHHNHDITLHPALLIVWDPGQQFE